jgi:hypothetical protein
MCWWEVHTGCCDHITPHVIRTLREKCPLQLEVESFENDASLHISRDTFYALRQECRRQTRVDETRVKCNACASSRAAQPQATPMLDFGEQESEDSAVNNGNTGTEVLQRAKRKSKDNGVNGDGNKRIRDTALLDTSSIRPLTELGAASVESQRYSLSPNLPFQLHDGHEQAGFDALFPSPGAERERDPTTLVFSPPSSATFPSFPGPSMSNLMALGQSPAMCHNCGNSMLPHAQSDETGQSLCDRCSDYQKENGRPYTMGLLGSVDDRHNTYRQPSPSSSYGDVMNTPTPKPRRLQSAEVERAGGAEAHDILSPPQTATYPPGHLLFGSFAAGDSRFLRFPAPVSPASVEPLFEEPLTTTRHDSKEVGATVDPTLVGSNAEPPVIHSGNVPGQDRQDQPTLRNRRGRSSMSINLPSQTSSFSKTPPANIVFDGVMADQPTQVGIPNPFLGLDIPPAMNSVSALAPIPPQITMTLEEMKEFARPRDAEEAQLLERTSHLSIGELDMAYIRSNSIAGLPFQGAPMLRIRPAQDNFQQLGMPLFGDLQMPDYQASPLLQNISQQPGTSLLGGNIVGPNVTRNPFQNISQPALTPLFGNNTTAPNIQGGQIASASASATWNNTSQQPIITVVMILKVWR